MIVVVSSAKSNLKGKVFRVKNENGLFLVDPEAGRAAAESE